MARMFRGPGWLLSFLLLTPGVIYPQVAQPQREEPHLSIRSASTFSIRILEAHIVVTGGTTRTCMIVYPNNSFHFEIWQQSGYDQKSRLRYVTESTLTNPQSD